MKMFPVTQKNQIFFIQQSSRSKKYFIRILTVRAQVKETPSCLVNLYPLLKNKKYDIFTVVSLKEFFLSDFGELEIK